VCAQVGNQRSRGVVTARVRTDAVRSLRHQRHDLHQSDLPVPLGRLGLILLSAGEGVAHGQVDEPLAGARVAARLSSDGEGWRQPKAHGGGMLRCKREGKEDDVG
jgi:hypothetical protein